MIGPALAVAIVLLLVAVARAARPGARRHFSGVDQVFYQASDGPAADALARVNRRMDALLHHLGTRAAAAPAPAGPGARIAHRLIAKFQPSLVHEDSESYTQDGRVALCLRGPDGALHDLDLLTFVALHEAAHLAAGAVTPGDYAEARLADAGGRFSEEGEHSGPFWATFAFLLRESAVAGIYTAPDFARAPTPYCQMVINYNPVRDPLLARLEW